MLAIPALGQQQGNAGKPVLSPSPRAAKASPAPKELRDPFWPVTYVKAAEQAPVPDAGSTQPSAATSVGTANWPALNLKATMKNPAGKTVAIIEGVGVVEAGDIINLKKEGMIYRYKIEAVTDKGLNYQKLDARPAK